MQKKIVITRARVQGQNFINKFCEAYGDSYQGCFLLEPLTEIDYFLPAKTHIANYDRLIVTSPNAVEGISEIELPFYCVGEGAAKKLGGQPKFVAQDVDDLKAGLETEISTQRFLYLRGQDVRCDLKSFLERRGHRVDEVVTYDARAVDKLSEGFLQAMHHGDIGAITFFSGRGAQIFSDLCRDIVFQNPIHALCLSARVVEYVHSDLKTFVRVCERPDMQAMMDCIVEILEKQKRG